MSSLLDVLHKRPPRSQSLAAEAVQPATVVEPAPADASMTVQGAELRLAPEHDAAATLSRQALLPAADDPTVHIRQAASATAADETVQARRWSDPPPTPHLPPAAAPVAAIKAPAGSRKPRLVAIVAAAAIAAAGYLAFQFMAPSEEGFLAPSADVAPAAAPPAAAQPEGTVAVAAEQPVVTAKKKRRPKPAVADEESPVADDRGEVPWYDQPALPAEAAAEARVIEITRGSTRNPLFEKLSAAYAALLAGDNVRAESLYREVLAADAASADALLGLGSLAARGGRDDEARDLYRTVQRLDPKNAAAAAALSALSGGSARAGTESELKDMLREQPNSASLHFALGLRYVADERWPDAQSSFFDAVRNDPTNADYAFNLAVSLDRLGQRQPAASYYRRALDLAAGSQQFDTETARARLAVLSSPPG